MKTKLLLSLVAVLGCGSLALAQSTLAPAPEPVVPHPAPSASSPDSLNKLVDQLRNANFDQRDAMAAAFETANAEVDTRLSEWRAAGTTTDTTAEENLSISREKAVQKIRDMTLSTEETWLTARDTAVTALQDLRKALEYIKRPDPATK